MRSLRRRDTTSICPPDAPSTVGSGGGERGRLGVFSGFSGCMIYDI